MRTGRGQVLKRGLDLCLGGLSLMLLLPLMLLAALAIWVTNGRPIFYTQEREGFGGRPIRLLKLRTMVKGAEDRLKAHLDSNPEARDEWERTCKLRSDPRIIPVVGSLLRRFSLDEAPQLWQVLTGELSLVGPRPLPKYHLQNFPASFRNLRRRVRPGVTGLWQVMVRSDGDLDVQRMYDSYYIFNWSVWMDLYVLAKTAGAVLIGRGAF
jgi:lipopolysaccharide/colanic/teichoic acid biosynthesis glycosyltransferase